MGEATILWLFGIVFSCLASLLLFYIGLRLRVGKLEEAFKEALKDIKAHEEKEEKVFERIDLNIEETRGDIKAVNVSLLNLAVLIGKAGRNERHT